MAILKSLVVFWCIMSSLPQLLLPSGVFWAAVTFRGARDYARPCFHILVWILQWLQDQMEEREQGHIQTEVRVSSILSI